MPYPSQEDYLALLNNPQLPVPASMRLFFQAFGIDFSSQGLLLNPDLFDSPPALLHSSPFSPLKIAYHWLTNSTLDLGIHSPLNTVLWADAQLAARGQYERRWCSALGRQLQVTLVLPPLSIHPLRPLYTLLQTLLPFNPHITFKWPNDLYLHNTKLAGMLIHHLNDRTLISFGLNTTFSQSSPPIAPLWHHAHPLTRLDLLSRFLHNWLSLNPLEDELLNFLLSRHIIPPGSSCHFSSNPDRPLLFHGLLPDGSLNLLDADGKTVEMPSGSLLLEKSFS